MNCLNSTAEEIQGCGQSGAGFAHIKRVCARKSSQVQAQPRWEATAHRGPQQKIEFPLFSLLI